MRLSTFITQVKHWVLQNYWTLIVDDTDAIFQTSNMLSYIYSYRVWKWALVREEITAVNWTFNLANTAVAIFRIEDSEWKEYKPAPMPFDSADSIVSWKNLYFNRWNSVVLSTDADTIKIWYLKLPARLQLNSVDDEIDLPDEYINILYLLVMWMLYPYNLENGASLANNFKAMAEDVLKTYEKTHSLWIAPTSVQFADIFNWK